MSEGDWIRRVIVKPNGRYYSGAVILAGACAGFLRLSVYVLTQPDPADVIAGFVVVSLAIVTGLLSLYLAFGHEQLSVFRGQLLWKRAIGWLALNRDLPVAGVQEIQVRPVKRGWSLAPHDMGGWVTIRFSNGAIWRVASGLKWATPELQWIADHLRAGVELPRD